MAVLFMTTPTFMETSNCTTLITSIKKGYCIQYFSSPMKKKIRTFFHWKKSQFQFFYIWNSYATNFKGSLTFVISETAINRNISTVSNLKSMYFVNYIILKVLIRNKKCHRKWKTVTYFLRKWQTSRLSNDRFTSKRNVKFPRWISKMWVIVTP